MKNYKLYALKKYYRRKIVDLKARVYNTMACYGLVVTPEVRLVDRQRMLPAEV